VTGAEHGQSGGVGAGQQVDGEGVGRGGPVGVRGADLQNCRDPADRLVEQQQSLPNRAPRPPRRRYSSRLSPGCCISRALGARSRSVVSAVMTALTGFRKFARWLDARGVMLLTDIDHEMLSQYAAYLGEKGSTGVHEERQLFALTRVWAYAPHLLPEDRLVMPPWDDPGAAVIDFLGDDFRRERGENQEVASHHVPAPGLGAAPGPRPLAGHHRRLPGLAPAQDEHPPQ
jgi:hypothetical protein